jgi:hypothetical protein
MVVLVPSENTILLRNPDNLLDAGQALHILNGQRLGIANQIYLGKRLLDPDFAMYTRGNTRQISEVGQ